MINDESFKKLYFELGLIDNNGEMLTLHSDCPNCDYCWQKIQGRKPGNNGFWTATRPWIGKKYSDLQLLVIAINMNEYGSYDGAINLIEQAKDEIRRGIIKTFVSETYSGTFLFHRMGSYVTSFATRYGLFKPTWIGDYPSPPDIVSAFEFISYTNQIKCSPTGEKSKPSYQMWERCGNFILKPEIELLNPKRLLVLGNSDNIDYLNQKVLDTEITLKWKGKIGIGNGYINTKPIEIFVVPHPASFGGNSPEIMNDLNCVLNNRC